jgi:hypothetical protein
MYPGWHVGACFYSILCPSLIISGAGRYCVEELCVKCAFVGQWGVCKDLLYSPLVRDVTLWHAGAVVTYQILSDHRIGVRG